MARVSDLLEERWDRGFWGPLLGLDSLVWVFMVEGNCKGRGGGDPPLDLPRSCVNYIMRCLETITDRYTMCNGGSSCHILAP